MGKIIDWLVGWPERTARYLAWLGPLFARLVVGYTFLLSGWGKFQDLPRITANFVDWGIPYPQLLTPLVSGIELVGGLFLLLGLLTRISAGALGVTMLVAIKSAKLTADSTLEDLLGFDETAYLAIFLWLATAGAGAFSIDRYLARFTRTAAA
jgi:putative oxidoreductase